MHKLILSVLLILVSVTQLTAQTASEAGPMESNGKIYVVMAVCLTILAGLLFYVISIDRKLTNIEKKKD